MPAQLPIKIYESQKMDYKPYFKEGSFTFESGCNMMNELLMKIIFQLPYLRQNDVIALGAMKAIREK